MDYGIHAFLHKFIELQATREKNGIYIPRDRYQSDEAAQKVLIPATD